MRPLEGVKVLDFSTLLPGPLATLLLAEAGAEVIKIERPGSGDEMRSYTPRVGPDSVNFALLNRGKRSIALDLKQDKHKLEPLLREADVLVEQFRPGVMDRLGLGYETLKDLNAGLVYCAITGYGQHGPRAQVAAHDLNYLAESGLLSLGQPAVPPALIADIAGGAYPAVMNILLALRRRERDGKGCKLDVSMSDNLFTFMYWALGDGQAAGRWPGSAESLVTGGSPRYNVYRTRDGRFVAAAPLEDRFWQNFCAVLSIPTESSIEGVQKRIAEKTSEEWRAAFAGKDVCCAIVATVREAFDDPHFRGRGLFAHKVKTDAGELIATPVPVAGAFRDPAPAGYPRLGEANDLLKR
jgi:crotonobetainyl-CoA:carnitine CoA-transferase CaiB-like acyl-CoA transferase